MTRPPFRTPRRPAPAPAPRETAFVSQLLAIEDFDDEFPAALLQPGQVISRAEIDAPARVRTIRTRTAK